jgi:hypothetical protein
MGMLAGFALIDLELSQRVDKTTMSLAPLLSDPDFITRYIEFKNKRNELAGGEGGNVPMDRILLYTIAASYSRDGWIRQSRMMQERMGYAGRSAAWERFCVRNEELLRWHGKRFGKTAKRRHGASRTVRNAQRLEEPKALLQVVVTELDAEWRKLDDRSAEKKKTLQDCAWAGVASQAPLRTETWVNMDWRSDGSGHIGFDAEGYFLDIPAEEHKNERGEAVSSGYYRRLRDQWGLYNTLDALFGTERAKIVGLTETTRAFVFGTDRTVDALMNNPENTEASKEALRRRVRRFTSRIFERLGLDEFDYLAPSDFRDIVAKSVRNLGGLQLSADAIADDSNTTKVHYAPERAAERADQLYRVQSLGADRATQLGAELRRSARANSKTPPTRDAARRRSREPSAVRSRRETPRRRAVG